MTTMLAFGETAEQVGSTASKLEKVRVLAAYLRELDDTRLAVATRWFAGRTFAAWDPRVLQVGGSALSKALRAVTGAGEAELRQVWSHHADVGDTAFDLFLRAGRDATGIDLLEVQQAFDAMALLRGPNARTEALTALLGRLSPLEAKYVTKLIAGELRIGLREGLVEDAVGRAFERDGKAVQRADMMVGDLGEVALLARRDELEQARPRLFAPLRFMLASPVADADEVVRRLGETVWIEDKYDGIRCQLHRGAGRVALYSRDLRDISDQFPEVALASEHIAPGAVLDGELLAMRDGAVLPFQSLQARLGRKNPSSEVLAAAPVVMVAWDLLLQNGESLLDVALRERRARLEGLGLGPGFALAHLEEAHGAAEVEQCFIEARARLNEGLMAKDPASPYLPGRRGLFWLKLKKPLDTVDVVIIGAEYGHGRRRSVLSDVTFAVEVDGTGELVPVGKAYTGLTDAEIVAMTAQLEAATVQRFGRYRSVEPRIVLEVAFDRIQPSARHRSGYAMRFPRIVRWRHDKGLADIDTLSRVRAVAEAGHAGAGPRVDSADGAEPVP